jgi:hypothetical protein
MRRKLSTGQISMMKQWLASKLDECNGLIMTLASMSIVDAGRGPIHDRIRECEDAIDYYDECIRTGTTD